MMLVGERRKLLIFMNGSFSPINRARLVHRRPAVEAYRDRGKVATLTSSQTTAWNLPLVRLLRTMRHAVALLDGRPSRHAEPRIARQVAFSTRQLVWLDSRAERTRSACAPSAGWVQLMSRSLLEMWSDSSGMHSTLHDRVG